MDLERLLHLGEDMRELPRLHASARPVSTGGDDRFRVAVHRITDPNHSESRIGHGAHEARKAMTDLMGAKASHEQDSARLITRIERANRAQERFRSRVGTDLDADRIRKTPAELDMSAIRITRAKSNPRYMRREIEPAFAARHLARQR